MNVLNKKQTDQFHKKGYTLHHDQLFDSPAFERLERIMKEHLENKGTRLSDELDTPHFRDPRLFDFLMSDEALGMVEDILGPNIGLWSSHFICKDPFLGRRTPWHEDSAYWKGRFDRLDKIVTIWLAMDNTFPENGCMGVIPGTHINGFSDYENVDTRNATFAEEIKPDSFDLSKVVWFELKKGECSLHDGRIIHGANANNSRFRRCGYTMRYFALDMKLNESHPDNRQHKIYHARGSNLANNPLIYL